MPVLVRVSARANPLFDGLQIFRVAPLEARLFLEYGTRGLTFALAREDRLDKFRYLNTLPLKTVTKINS